jgi:hypothetical protein
VGHVARMGTKMNGYILLIVKPEGGPSHRSVENIKMGVVWTGLLWLRIGTNGELLRMR